MKLLRSPFARAALLFTKDLAEECEGEEVVSVLSYRPRQSFPYTHHDGLIWRSRLAEARASVHPMCYSCGCRRHRRRRPVPRLYDTAAAMTTALAARGRSGGCGGGFGADGTHALGRRT